MNFTMERDYPEFVVFDLETTGFGAAAGVTEIGAVKVQYRDFTDRFSSFVDPGMPIPYQIRVLTGITDEMVAGAPTFAELLPRFLAFADGLPLVAHNARFDCSFLSRTAQELGISIQNPVVDTLKLARRVWPKLPSYRLTYLTAYHDILQEDAHRAWCDAQATAKLYLLMHTK